MFHVTILCKEKLPTRHLERSREISIIVCLQTIIFLKEIKKMFFYISAIHKVLIFLPYISKRTQKSSFFMNFL